MDRGGQDGGVKYNAQRKTTEPADEVAETGTNAVPQRSEIPVEPVTFYGTFTGETHSGSLVFMRLNMNTSCTILANFVGTQELEFNTFIYGINVTQVRDSVETYVLKGYSIVAMNMKLKIGELERVNMNPVMRRHYERGDSWIKATKLYPLNHKGLFGDITDQELDWIEKGDDWSLVRNSLRPFAWTFFEGRTAEKDARLVMTMNQLIINTRRVVVSYVDLGMCLRFMDGLAVFHLKDYFVNFDGKNEEETNWLKLYFPDMELGCFTFRWIYEQMRPKPEGVILINKLGVPPSVYRDRVTKYECDTEYPWYEYVYKKQMTVTMMNWKGWTTEQNGTDQISGLSFVREITEKQELELKTKGTMIQCEYSMKQRLLISRGSDGKISAISSYEFIEDEPGMVLVNGTKRMDIRQMGLRYEFMPRCLLEDLLLLPDQCVQMVTLRRVFDPAWYHAAARVAKKVYRLEV